MWVRIAVAFVAPILAAALVVGVLKAVHHTGLPQLVIPTAPSAASFTKSAATSKPIPTGPCLGKVPHHFAGLAVKNSIEQNVASFAKVTGHQPQIVEFYNPFLGSFAAPEALHVVNSGKIPLV